MGVSEWEITKRNIRSKGDIRLHLGTEILNGKGAVLAALT